MSIIPHGKQLGLSALQTISIDGYQLTPSIVPSTSSAGDVELKITIFPEPPQRERNLILQLAERYFIALISIDFLKASAKSLHAIQSL